MWRDLVEGDFIIYVVSKYSCSKTNQEVRTRWVHSMITKPDMILGGAEGQKDLKLYWQTNKASLKQGLPDALWSILKRKLLQLLIIISKRELVHSVAVTSWSRAAFGNSEPPVVFLETALPTGVGERCHSVAECPPKGQQRLLAPVSCNSRVGLSLCFARFDLVHCLLWRLNWRTCVCEGAPTMLHRQWDSYFSTSLPSSNGRVWLGATPSVKSSASQSLGSSPRLLWESQGGI